MTDSTDATVKTDLKDEITQLNTEEKKVSIDQSDKQDVENKDKAATEKAEEGRTGEAKTESVKQDGNTVEEEEEDPIFARLADKYNLNVTEEELKDEEEEKEDSDDECVSIHSTRYVDLAKINKRYDFKKSSALQNLLVQYGRQDSFESIESSIENIKISKKRSRKKVWDLDDEAENKVFEHDFKFKPKSFLPTALHDDYDKIMEEKIAKQRKYIFQRSLELQKKLDEREKHHQKVVGFTKKLKRNEFTHNIAFKQHLPKSDHYKMISIENKLKMDGKLRSKADYDEFWSCYKNPVALREYLKKTCMQKEQPTMQESQEMLESSYNSSRTSSMSSLTQEKERTATDFRPLTQIEEGKEPSRPSTRGDAAAGASKSWAITQEVQAVHGPTRKADDPCVVAKIAAMELEKKFPRMELPSMHCFTDEISLDGKDPDEVLREWKASRREKERKIFVKRLRKMYNLAQSNKATAERMLQEKQEDFVLDTQNSIADSWLALEVIRDDDDKRQLTEEERALLERPWLRYVRNRAIGTIVEESEPATAFNSATVPREKPWSKASKKANRMMSMRQVKLPALPLSIDALEENSKIKESKCISTKWINYLGVGKSVFAE